MVVSRSHCPSLRCAVGARHVVQAFAGVHFVIGTFAGAQQQSEQLSSIRQTRPNHRSAMSDATIAIEPHTTPRTR